jgi:GMP synthase (glutamine-hydrolysing)
VDDLCLANLATAVRLSNGSCGIAMNYDRQGVSPALTDGMASKMEQRLAERVVSESLLEGTLYDDSEGPTLRSLTVALLSALATPLLNAAHLTPRGARVIPIRAPIEHWRNHGSKIAIIGCGGYAADAIFAEHTKEVVVSDLAFNDPEARDFYRPFIEKVVEPNRQRKTITLTDGGDNEKVLSECEVLFITASTLINGTLFNILEMAGPKAAIILEGNTAGMYPPSLFALGVTHLVQTVVDIDYVSLSKRFARQTRQGHIRMLPAQFTETILPERRTIERLPSYRPGPRAARTVLLLQARHWHDPMIGHEIDCFREKLPESVEMVTFNLVDDVPTEEVLDGVCAVLVGGSGDYGSAGNQHPWFFRSLKLLSLVVEKGLPMLCSCWGHQALAVALGGEVVHDPLGYELGVLPIDLTVEGQQDPLFAELGTPFLAPLGHCEQVSRMPNQAVLLASTQRCPVQAYRLADKPVYATQFHPEMTGQQLYERVDSYVISRETTDRPPASQVDRLLERFLALYL